MSASRLASFAKAALTQQWSVLAFLIVSFIVAQAIVLALHIRTTQMDRDVQEVQLARDLYREFYADDKGYLRIANAIEACEKLYKGDGGKFSHLQINEYLGFFSDLGLFMQRGSLSPELIGHFFGAYIVEAHEYPEINTYIERIRKNFQQPEAFAGFETVAQAMVKDPRFASLVTLTQTMCPDQAERRHRHEEKQEDCRRRPLPARGYGRSQPGGRAASARGITGHPGPDAAPGGPDVKADEETEASDGTSESAGEDTSSPPYRHRPGACPEGPPCQNE